MKEKMDEYLTLRNLAARYRTTMNDYSVINVSGFQNLMIAMHYSWVEFHTASKGPYIENDKTIESIVNEIINESVKLDGCIRDSINSGIKTGPSDTILNALSDCFDRLNKHINATIRDM